ncbi:MAG: transcription antitermination factor NusB [Vallitalea sp.]|nr:transcription antitermination factor NusB [Vallitalea sp.]
MNRRTMREHIFKAIFLLEFNDDEEFSDKIDTYLSDFQDINDETIQYISNKSIKINENLEALDNIINENAKNWSISRMSKVDVSILRLAIYEIQYDEDIPTNVAINEAVEIAKKFGGDSSPSFINGILAKVVNK